MAEGNTPWMKILHVVTGSNILILVLSLQVLRTSEYLQNQYFIAFSK
jgi:hypothetical protein